MRLLLGASREPAHDSEDLLEHAGVRVLDADEKSDAGDDRDEEVNFPVRHTFKRHDCGRLAGGTPICSSQSASNRVSCRL